VQEHPNDRFDLLNPALQKALNCLDIKLEDELNRFRAIQQENIPSEAKTKNTPPDLAAEDSHVSTITWEQSGSGAKPEPEILTAQIVRSGLPQPSAEHQWVEPSGQDDLNRSRLQPETAPISGFVIIDGLTASSSSDRSAITRIDYAPIALHRSNLPTSQPGLNLNFSTGGEIAPYYDGYSSSSQELLRQIQSGYPAGDAVSDSPEPAAATPPKNKLFTPLKVGSMAAACAIAGGVVYTCLNPSILAPLIATKAIAPTATTSALGQLIQSPNLAANEFTELNLSRLSTIKLPTPTTANVSPAISTLNAPQAGVATAPVAIPFTGSKVVAPTAMITAQPRLADSLVRSLLPPNFHSFAKPSGYRATPSKIGR
jgi:hypothetical protein